MRSIRTYTVLPSIPDRLQSLQALAYNLWWCWNADAVALFRRIDPDLFESLDHSPIRLLTSLKQERYDQLANDDGFLAHLDRVNDALNHYMKGETWFRDTYGHSQTADARIAYFSAEFGIHESVPVYSGGLGVLAGDHLKSASDLGLPLVGVSLMYREGYFRQYLNVDGWQQERYPENDFFTLPLIPELDANQQPIIVSVPLPGREVALRVWHIQVGRVPLYLLDANIPQNRPEDRAITAQLYGGDSHTRIQQEIILGIGGLRALRAIGKEPTVCHMNEGHAAFVSLERTRTLMEQYHLDFATASEAVQAGTCFTTHTPVPAGNDAFPPHMIDQYFGDYFAKLGIDRQQFLSLGRIHPHDESEPFSMTVLAIKLANTSNGVSALHGEVSRKMWAGLFPTLPASEVPITSITNGVHTQTWLSPEIANLFDRYIGVHWEEEPTNHAVWKRVESIPDAELWRTHERCRERLIVMARQRLKAQLTRRGSPQAEIERAEEVLDPEALTIGFARRFATYKRGDLLFRDIERLLTLLNTKERPIQFIFAGKAHPKDTGGKELIARVAQFAKREEFRRRVMFIEDYDMNICRALVQGVDVWLNNPRRPLEASGTSGMKVACNGGLNMSILDGWWCEGYDGTNGWAIGSGEEYPETEDGKRHQDDIESRALYELLEREVLPMFYQRGSDDLPRAWIRRMKRCLATLVPVFNTNRMVQQYMERCYAHSHQRFQVLSAHQLQPAVELATWRKRVVLEWPNVRIESVTAPNLPTLKVGGQYDITVGVQLGNLAANEVDVQVCYGLVDNAGDVPHPKSFSLTTTETGQGRATFHGVLPCLASGQFGYSVRVLPKHDHLANPFEPGLITWG